MTVLTVSQLNFYIKSLMDNDENLRSVYLKGEISNLTDHYRTGHIYLSLKDEKCTIRGVMFAGNASRLKFRPENGMKVLVHGYVSVYNISGQYQIYIDDMQPEGIGALSLAFEQLKKKLSAQGLFSDDHKKPLPALPGRIGVITSPTGAAVQDILRILSRRYPIGEIIMCPVLVQGENAAAELTEAVRRFDRLGCADVIIIGRGGGSAEDLWAFNDESLARAIYDCRVPVVSGVGHETDFTICDLVADVRASTPSAAAELVSPGEGELKAATDLMRDKLIRAMCDRIASERSAVDRLSDLMSANSPAAQLTERQLYLDHISDQLVSSYRSYLAGCRNSLVSLASGLDALSPIKVIARGYSIAVKNGKTVTSVDQADKCDELDIILKDGSLRCSVIERKKTDGKIQL